MEREFLIELNELQKDSKIKISPIGERVVGRDGRVFCINADLVLKETKKGGVDLMLDIDHCGGEAVGWFPLKSLEVRDDGIYASLELTKKGEDLVQNKAYRYLSPAFLCEWEGEVRIVKALHSVGLVNHPNLLKKSLNSKEDEGLKKENEELKAKNEKLAQENEELKKEIKNLKALADKKLTEEKVKNALENNAMLPKRKDEALALNGEALDHFLEVCKSEAEMVLKKSDLTSLEKNKQGDEQAQKIAQSLGLENLD